MSLNINIVYEEVESVLENFYNVTGMPVGIYDLGLGPLIEYPKCTSDDEKIFCDVIRGLVPSIRYRCHYCIYKAIDKVCQTKKPYTFNCHFRFNVIVIPIIIYGEVVAFIKAGPIRAVPKDKYDLERIKYWVADRDYYEFSSEDMELLKKHFNKIKIAKDEKVESASFLLNLCIQHINANHWLICEIRNLFDDFEHYIKANIYKELSISNVAMTLKISHTYLRNIIRANKNMTFTDYVLNEKIEEAKRLIITTSMSVKEISTLLNFKDQAYFSRIFKKQTGYTCSAFRKRFIF